VPEHPEQWKTYVRRLVSELAIPGKFAVLTEVFSNKHLETNHRMVIISLRLKSKEGQDGQRRDFYFEA
jgi:hypothetical protein